MIAVAQPVNGLSPTHQQPKPNRIEILLKSVSASRLSAFLTCRLKFYFRYVVQIKKAQTPALFFGDVVHSVLRAWSMARWKREQFEVEKFKTLFEKGRVGSTSLQRPVEES